MLGNNSNEGESGRIVNDRGMEAVDVVYYGVDRCFGPLSIVFAVIGKRDLYAYKWNLGAVHMPSSRFPTRTRPIFRLLTFLVSGLLTMSMRKQIR